MGGFHGGHSSSSSSGGFHGGSSSSGHSGGYSSGGHSSSYHSSGSYSHSVYSSSSDGDSYSTGSGTLVVGIILVVLGLILFVIAACNIEIQFALLTPLSTAPVGIFLIVSELRSRKKEKEEIEANTDWNGDGKVDYKDEKYKKSLENFVVVHGQSKNNKVITSTCRYLGYVGVLFGIVLLILFYPHTCKATITETNIVSRFGDTYETYQFSYEFGGVLYFGSGDDDLAYVNGGYEKTILEGDVYDVYVALVSPSDYQFERGNLATGFGVGILVFSTVLIVVGALTRKKYLISIRHIGDLNGDGKVNEKDIEIYNKQAYLNMFENYTKRDLCPYCGSKLDKKSLFCTKCGARKQMSKE